MGFVSFWLQVEKAKCKTKALWHRAERGWKDGFHCFRPIAQMMPRCMSRGAYSSDVEPPDGRLYEDRPLLKHRHSVGFAARHAREKAEAAAERAQTLGSQVVKKGREASGELRRRAEHVAMNIPTPMRTRRSAKRGSYDSYEDAVQDAVHSGDVVFDDDDIFEIDEIGSDDEEESAFVMHPFEGSPFHTQPYEGSPFRTQPYEGSPFRTQPFEGSPLNDALSTFGRPGEAADKVPAMKTLPLKVSALNLGSLNPMRSPRDAGTPTSFYVGTPRADM